MNEITPLEDEMTVEECLEHLEEIKTRQKTVFQDASVRMAINIIKALERCDICQGKGTITVPDHGGESASEQDCPNPIHDIIRETT
jgi:hypothetical protein